MLGLTALTAPLAQPAPLVPPVILELTAPRDQQDLLVILELTVQQAPLAQPARPAQLARQV